MTDRIRSFLPVSNITKQRSHSCREKSSRAISDLEYEKFEELQRRFEKELIFSERELRRLQRQRHDFFPSTEQYLENLHFKLKNDYDQLVEERAKHIERYINRRCKQERRSSRRKLEDLLVESEKHRLSSIDRAIRERDAMYEEKLAAQQRFYDRLLQEQAQRVRAEHSLQSFEELNIEQLKDRFTRVEHSNNELKKVIRNLVDQPSIMSIKSMSTKSKKKVISQLPTSNQLENIKPIEVKCFLDENKIVIETNKEVPNENVSATMITVVPQPKRPISASSKKQTPMPVADIVISKPIRHLAILPSSDDKATKQLMKNKNELSETFTTYECPPTTPNLARSVDDTFTINNPNASLDLKNEISANTDIHPNENNLCNNTTISSACELIDHSKLQQKPHSLIGRYQTLNENVTNVTKPYPITHIATVHYTDTQETENDKKQILIEQFYAQLEKMKATFNIEQQSETSHQLTTNTLMFDNGQVTQVKATNLLKEKTGATRPSSATRNPIHKKPPIPQKPKTKQISTTRIHSAPVTMATRTNVAKTRNQAPFGLCKPRRTEKSSFQPKKVIRTQTQTKEIRRVESAPANRIDIRGSEVTLLPNDEQECQRIYEKLQRLQPNGTCVDLNTLRRALYPPVGNITYSSAINSDQASPFKPPRPRIEEMPLSWIKVDDKYMSRHMAMTVESNKSESNSTITKVDPTDIDRITEQVRKHAAINYTYYTRTK